MTIDHKFIDQFVKVTSKAALSSYYLIGKKDKVAADNKGIWKGRGINAIYIKSLAHNNRTCQCL